MGFCGRAAFLIVAMVACAPVKDSGSQSVVKLTAAIDSVSDLSHPEVALEVAPGVLVLPEPTVPGLIRLDFRTSKRDTVGRAGDGPGEFRSPFLLYPVGGGRIAVVDGLARRISILSSALAFEEQRASVPGLPIFTMRFDTLGNAFSQETVNRPFVAGDSVAILRSRHDVSSIDTIAFIERLHLLPLQFGTSAMMVPAEYAPRDLWGVHPDGTVWIARGERRQLEIHSTDGHTVRTALPFQRINTIDADLGLFRGLSAPPEMKGVKREMAPVKGAFQEARAGAGNSVFLWLNQPAGYTRELYAEFDANGQLVRTIALPLASKVLVVGSDFLYVTHENGDGTWTAIRFRRPRPFR